MSPGAQARCGAVALVGALVLAPSAVAAPSIDITVEPRVRIDRPVMIRGTAGEAGRLVVVVRNANGRVLGRTIRDPVRAGRFGLLVRLGGAARPGPVRVSAVLTGAGRFEPVRDEARSEIVAIEPNFLAAFPSPWPRRTPVPVTGRIAFPGRMVIVVRTRAGKPLGRAVVTMRRKGAFRARVRLNRSARAGAVRVTATLRSGSLIARGRGALTLA